MEFESQKFVKFIKSAWAKYETGLVLGLGLILIAIISFEFGYVQGRSGKTAPIVIEKASGSLKTGPESPVDATMGTNTTATPKAPIQADLPIPANCAYVASKNSNKFHVATCQWAKRIKPENLVCFKSAEDAIAQGKLADKCVK